MVIRIPLVTIANFHPRSPFWPWLAFALLVGSWHVAFGSCDEDIAEHGLGPLSPSLVYTDRQARIGAMIGSFVHQLDEPAEPIYFLDLAEQKKLAVASGAAFFTISYLAPNGLSDDRELFRSYRGNWIAILFPNPLKSPYQAAKITAQYCRLDPQLLFPDAESGPLTEALALSRSRNAVAAYRDQIRKTEPLRQVLPAFGFIKTVVIHYSIAVKDGAVEGQIKEIESSLNGVVEGSIDESRSRLTQLERSAAGILTEEGNQVIALKAVNLQGQRTADIKVVNGAIEQAIEIKSPSDDETGDVKSETIKNRVWSSLQGGGQSPHILIDARNSNLTLEEAQRGAFRIAGLLKQEKYRRYRDRLRSLRIVGIEDEGRFDLRFSFTALD